GDTYTVVGDYSLHEGDSANIGNFAIDPAAAGHVDVGPIQGATEIAYHTGPLGTSPGFSNLRARCSMSIQCHGPTCFTTPSLLPTSEVPGHDRVVFREWTPCSGRGFKLRARYQMLGGGQDWVTFTQLNGAILPDDAGSTAGLPGNYTSLMHA